MKKNIFIVIAVTAIWMSGNSAIAAPIYGSEVRFDVCGGDDICIKERSNGQNYLGTTSSANLTNETYQDLRYYGLNDDEPVSTIVTFSGDAQSSSTGLRASVSGSQLSEAYTPNSGDVLESKMAQHSISSRASFYDNLTFTGASNLHSIMFDVNIHGTRANAPFGSYIQVNDGSGVLFSSNNSIWDGIDDFDITNQSALFHLSGGIASISLSLETMLDFFVGGEAIMNDMLGMYREVDFFNTITFGQFRGYNASGDLVDLESATGSDGAVYDVLRVASSTVPEPSAIWLVSIGLIGLIGMSKKNSNNHTLLA